MANAAEESGAEEAPCRRCPRCIGAFRRAVGVFVGCPQGATYVKVEAERYIGRDCTVYAVSAEHWPTTSERNPGKLRQYLIEPMQGGQARMAEIGNGKPVDLDAFDLLAR